MQENPEEFHPWTTIFSGKRGLFAGLRFVVLRCYTTVSVKGLPCFSHGLGPGEVVGSTLGNA